MLSLYGDWLHPRSSSKLSELVAVRKLVIESSNPIYSGKSWSAGRQHNSYLFSFAGHIGVEPSTMQTKIRAMIKFGFLEDNKILPLKWTKLGELWNDLYSLGNLESANEIYQIILTISLSLVSFKDQHDFCVNPHDGDMPLKFLLNNLDSNNSITLTQLSKFIDGKTSRAGKNLPYWKDDLLNSGLFVEYKDSLFYSKKYPEIVNVIKRLTPNHSLTQNDWVEIRRNPLIKKSPYAEVLKESFVNIALRKLIIDGGFSDLVEPLIESVARENELLIDDSLDILSTDVRFATSTRRIRNNIWAKKVKKSYKNMCCIPECDTQGDLFVTAAHIKPDNLPETGTPHRAHILNGISLCRNCHIAFDNGYFTLTEDGYVIVSSEIEKIADQHVKKVIVDSSRKQIRSRQDSRLPLKEFILYHQENIFKK